MKSTLTSKEVDFKVPEASDTCFDASRGVFHPLFFWIPKGVGFSISPFYEECPSILCYLSLSAFPYLLMPPSGNLFSFLLISGWGFPHSVKGITYIRLNTSSMTLTTSPGRGVGCLFKSRVPRLTNLAGGWVFSLFKTPLLNPVLIWPQILWSHKYFFKSWCFDYMYSSFSDLVFRLLIGYPHAILNLEEKEHNKKVQGVGSYAAKIVICLNFWTLHPVWPLM